MERTRGIETSTPIADRLTMALTGAWRASRQRVCTRWRCHDAMYTRLRIEWVHPTDSLIQAP